MAERVATVLEERFQVPRDRVLIVVRRGLMALAALTFVLFATMIVAFDSVFLTFNNIATLQEGDIAPRDIVAPPNPSPYVSDILTDLTQAEARNAVQPVFDAPDPNVARQQTQFAQQILAYTENVRADSYGGDLRLHDLDSIVTLELDEETNIAILELGDEAWREIETEILNVLSLAMRNVIQPDELQRKREQLRIQVSPSFTPRETGVIVAVVENLVQPNTFENVEATNSAREQATAAVEAQTRQLIGGQVIVREGEVLDDLDYEALQALNLLQSEDIRSQQTGRALVASTLVMVIIGLYMSRFVPHLFYDSTRMLTLMASIFLIMLAATRFLGVNGNIYLFPTAAMAMLYVAIAGPHVAIIASLSLAFLTGMMTNDSLEIATLIASGGLISTLVLRSADRLNSFFVAGAVTGVINAAVIGIFSLATPFSAGDIGSTSQLGVAFLGGILLAPATAIAAMYIVTMLFNLPTALKLIDLSQPNKPLLQRLLREAPGTYQHSLQVANLSEQAANAIGADAQLTHVAALYHDIGKMLNPLYFTENQQDTGNPHDTLNDPYRSADIIISHATEGDEMAKQYRLPARLRDFIREHHGTTQVYVFYQQALNQVDGDESAIDITDFTYPGPRPQSKETAILMMADSCEAAVRSIKPDSRQAISDLVGNIIEDKRRTGQLDKSHLTLNDLRAIRTIFVDILQGMFHPRINYNEAVKKKGDTTPRTTPSVSSTVSKGDKLAKAATQPITPAPAESTTVAKAPTAPKKSNKAPATPTRPTKPATAPGRPAKSEGIAPPGKTVSAEMQEEIADEEPISEVPRLPSAGERRTNGPQQPAGENGKPQKEESKPESDES